MLMHHLSRSGLAVDRRQHPPRLGRLRGDHLAGPPFATPAVLGRRGLFTEGTDSLRGATTARVLATVVRRYWLLIRRGIPAADR